MPSKSVGSILASIILILGFLSAMGLVAGQEEEFSGNVYNENENNGIDGARVEFQSEEDPYYTEDATTDYSGHYSVYLEPGYYTITVSANDYDTRVYDRIYLENGNYEEFFLSPQYNDGGGYDGNDGSDGDGEEGGDEQNVNDFMPMGLEENGPMYMGLCFSFIIIIVISFLILACASLGIFVRLGKIRKDMDKMKPEQPPRHSDDYYRDPPPRHSDDYYRDPPPRRSDDYYQDPPPRAERRSPPPPPQPQPQPR